MHTKMKAKAHFLQCIKPCLFCKIKHVYKTNVRQMINISLCTYTMKAKAHFLQCTKTCLFRKFKIFIFKNDDEVKGK